MKRRLELEDREGSERKFKDGSQQFEKKILMKILIQIIFLKFLNLLLLLLTLVEPLARSLIDRIIAIIKIPQITKIDQRIIVDLIDSVPILTILPQILQTTVRLDFESVRIDE